MRSQNPVTNTPAGMALMVLAMVFITGTEVFVKLATATLPVGELIFLRGVFATLILGAIMVATGSYAPIWSRWSRPLTIRLIAELGATICYITALAYIPLADASAIIQVAPLFALALAALLLGQAVGWRRWSATLVGFIGVLLVVQPGAQAFQPAGFLAVGAAACVATRDLATRYLDAHLPTVMVALTTSIALMAFGASFAVVEVWVVPTWYDLWLTFASALLLAVFYLLIIQAFRIGDATAVAPMRYSKMVWALMGGWLIWGDWPDALAFVGIGMIVAAGLYAFWREQRLARQGDPLPSPPTSGSVPSPALPAQK